MIRELQCFTVFLSLIVGVAPPSANARSVAGLNLDAAPVTADGIAAAAMRARALHCRTSACTAIIVIDGLIQIEQDRADHETMGLVLDNGQTPIAHARIQRLLLRRKALYNPVCAMAARILSRIHLGRDPDAITPGVILMDDAVETRPTIASGSTPGVAAISSARLVLS